jgi:ABC-2 type transport system permease protein
MRNALAVARREINAAFLSLLAWTVLTIFLIFSGLFFWLFTSQTHQASLEGTVGIISFFFLVATPLLTMRLLSEEYRSGTIETLMTAPVTEFQVILGKFIGALAFYGFMLAPTLAYAAILRVLGKPDIGVMFSSYLGLIAMGCEFIALGLFCSSVTHNQIVAAVFALVALLVLWILGSIGDFMPPALRPVIEYMGTLQHLRGFTAGRIAFRDLFYFASTTAFWLFLSVRVLESKRWR